MARITSEKGKQQHGDRYTQARYQKNLCNAVGSSAAPYGYTLATWTTGAVLTNARGIPDTLSAPRSWPEAC